VKEITNVLERSI